jgi:hypothetical protein
MKTVSFDLNEGEVLSLLIGLRFGEEILKRDHEQLVVDLYARLKDSLGVFSE